MTPFRKILNAYADLITALSEIHTQVQNNTPIMVTAAEVRQVITLFNSALDAQAGSTAALAALSTQLTALQSQITDLNDPALDSDLQAVIAKAAAASVPPVVTPLPPPPPVDVPPVVDPNATNPDGSLVSGNVTNPDGSVTTPAGTVIPAPAPAP